MNSALIRTFDREISSQVPCLQRSHVRKKNNMHILHYMECKATTMVLGKNADSYVNNSEVFDGYYAYLYIGSISIYLCVRVCASASACVCV